MEPCTSAHFSNIPQIKNNVDALGINNWMCLPLNNKIELGGRLDVSNITTSLQVEIICDRYYMSDRSLWIDNVISAQFFDQP